MEHQWAGGNDDGGDEEDYDDDALMLMLAVMFNVHASMQFGEKLMIKFSAKLKSSLRWNERLANLNKLKLSKL